MRKFMEIHISEIIRDDQDFLLKAARHIGITDKFPEIKKNKKKDWQAHNKVNMPLSWNDFFPHLPPTRFTKEIEFK